MCASAPALLASIISADPEAFYDAIVGRLQRLKREMKKRCLSTDTVGQVIRALGEFGEWHSNRVWASIPRLATESGIGERTVRRVLEWLREIGAIREIVGEELLAGRGAHEYPKELRKSELKIDSTCYDLSGLIALIPQTLRVAIELILSGDLRPLMPVRPVPPLADIETLYPDPFADPVTDPEPEKPLVTEPVLSSSPSLPIETKQGTEPLSTNFEPDSNRHCLVSPTDLETGEKTEGKQPTGAGSRIARPKMAHRYKAEKPDSAPPNPPKSRLAPKYTHYAPGPERDAYQGLRAVGISHEGAEKLISDKTEGKGPLFCLTLLAYGRFTRRKKTIGPGWYVNTARAHNGTWPDDFLLWHAKESAAAKRVRGAGAIAPKPRPASSPPTRPTRFIAPSAPANKALLEALTPADRADLESRARAQLREEIGAPPAPPLIRARMLAILKQHPEEGTQ